MNERVEKEFKQKKGPFEVKLEGLEDGYRFTIRGDEEKIRRTRETKASFIRFLRQADVAGYPIFFPFNLLLRFFARYRTPKN